MTRRLYPAREVAQELSLSLRTTRSLIASGELRSIKIGRARRVPSEAIDEYVDRLDTRQNGDAR